MRELLSRLEKRYEDTSEGMEVIAESAADIILKQLGGRNRLSAMIGARDIFSDDGGKTLVFKFPNRKKSAPNYVKITLTSMDLYDIEFGRITMEKDKDWPGIKTPKYKKLKTFDDIYADQLVDIFEKTTGLYLRL